MITEKVTHFYGCQMTTSYSAKQHKLRKLIAHLSEKQATNNEFVSLYIPAHASIDTIVANLKEDIETASLKSRNTNQRIQEALRGIILRLKQQKQAPENGLVLFAGIFAGINQDKETLNIEELVPPKPVNKFYREITNHFELEQLRQMLRDQRIVGLIAIDAKQATIAIRNGEHIEFLENLTSGVPGKTSKGGQSQRRYERERDMEITYFFNRIAEHSAKAFLEKQKATVLIVGGPGLTKNEFIKGNFLHYELKNALLNVVDTQTACEDGIREMLAKSSETLKSMCGPEEKKTMMRLEAELNKEQGLATTGLDSVLEDLKRGAVEIALITDDSDLYEVEALCKKCGLGKSEILKKKDTTTLQTLLATPCMKCKGIEWEIVEKDMVDVLEDAAAQTDAKVEVIFTGTEEKARLSALGGFAALLRYR